MQLSSYHDRVSAQKRGSVSLTLMDTGRTNNPDGTLAITQGNSGICLEW